ncbi:hypothetical protein HK104_008426 [Borealophlyctis nickersoniae]|nr:hypothetical protein HK104_008426 [Borealophlyctis nickersoniae]
MTVDESVINTTAGAVCGIVQDAHREFKGIPYATAGRWEAPKPVKPWEGVRDAKEFGDRFPQTPSPLSGKGPFLASTVPESENGHNLNVYTPRLKAIPSGGLPVLVWIYGGSLLNGSACVGLYNVPGFMSVVSEAGTPCIVVTFNYRVNAFGFLASKELAAESADGSVGNYGLLDQIAALEWVKENIAGFGGDKDKVTVFGESAGAVSIGYQLTLTRGLFHRAILQSGTASTMSPLPTPKLQPLFDYLVSSTNCPADTPPLTHLRSLPWQTILEKTVEALAVDRAKYVVRPCLDGVKVKEHPRKSIKEGRVDEGVKDFLMGDNLNEGTLFATTTQTESDYETFISSLPIPPNLQDTVRALYAQPEQTPFQRAASIFGDAYFREPVAYDAKELAKREGVKVYKYRWEKPMEATKAYKLGVHHAVELPYLFQSPLLTPSELPTAHSAARKWAHFATYGTVCDELATYQEGEDVWVFGEGGERAEKEKLREGQERVEFWEKVVAGFME